MKSSKKISVCLPFYNIEPYIRRCLDSVLENTYQNLEVICVNDGSTDGTSSLLHEYAEKDSRVIVIDQENGGVVSARNAAISVATGDFISFIDGDDWIHRQFYEVLMSIQAKSDADAVICSYRKIGEYTMDTELNVDEVAYAYAKEEWMLKDAHALTHVWGRLYKSDLIPKRRVDSDIAMGEDTALNLLFLYGKKQAKIAVTAEPLYYYFQRAESMVRTIPHAEKIKASKFLAENYSLFSISEQGADVILQEILRTLLAYRYLEMFSPEKQDVQKVCKELYTFCTDKWCGVVGVAERIQYQLLYHVPALYRLYRIITDPTMLDWERAEKKRQRGKRTK